MNCMEWLHWGKILSFSPCSNSSIQIKQQVDDTNAPASKRSPKEDDEICGDWANSTCEGASWAEVQSFCPHCYQLILLYHKHHSLQRQWQHPPVAHVHTPSLISGKANTSALSSLVPFLSTEFFWSLTKASISGVISLKFWEAFSSQASQTVPPTDPHCHTTKTKGPMRSTAKTEIINFCTASTHSRGK